MHTSLKVFLALIFSGLVAAQAQNTHFTPLALVGQTFIHDPSTILKDGTNYFIFGTAAGIQVKHSADLIHWENERAVFAKPPAWTATAVPEFKGVFWAPDVIRVNGKIFLYYAVSSWGKQVSAIGVATNTTLNTNSPDCAWHDCGPVIASTNGLPYNTIDPSAMLDADGKLWLAFGSYWDGIFLTELNPETGRRTAADSPIYRLAWNRSIEAACLTRHDDHYYLFVNWGSCCNGTNSTYEVRMGRADKITGPYLDRDGKALVTGGGSVFLHSQGKYFGPGHIGILNDGATPEPTRFSYHYYDAETQGKSRFAIGKIDWSDGWPVAAN